MSSEKSGVNSLGIPVADFVVSVFSLPFLPDHLDFVFFIL